MIFLLWACSPTPSLWMGGDLHFGEASTSPLSALSPLIEEQPGFVNLEGPFATQTEGTGLRLHSHPNTVEFLKNSHIIAVGTANNHRLDAGRFDSTPGTLNLAGIAQAEMDKVAFLKLGNKNISVVAWDLQLGLEGLATVMAHAKVSPDIYADAVIASFHVTGPPSYLPDELQKKAADLAILGGADVVVFHGSHVIGPIEHRKKVWIAWGLGNLAFACDCTDQKDALLLSLGFPNDRVTLRILPIQAGINGQAAQPAPHPDEIFDLLEAIGSPKLSRHGNYATLD